MQFELLEEDDMLVLPDIEMEVWQAKGSGLVYQIEFINGNVKGSVSCHPERMPYIKEADILSSVELKGKIYPITQISIAGFEGCENLKRIVIPDSITSIGFACFKDCISLEEVFIPDSVTHIGFGVFAGCKNLKKVSLPANLELSDNSFSFCNREKLIIERRP